MGVGEEIDCIVVLIVFVSRGEVDFLNVWRDLLACRSPHGVARIRHRGWCRRRRAVRFLSSFGTITRLQKSC